MKTFWRQCSSQSLAWRWEKLWSAVRTIIYIYIYLTEVTDYGFQSAAAQEKYISRGRNRSAEFHKCAEDFPDWSRFLPTAASPAGDRVRPLGHQPRAGEAGDALHLGQRHGVWPRRRDRRRVHGGTSQEPKGKADCSGGKPAVPWHRPGETVVPGFQAGLSPLR